MIKEESEKSLNEELSEEEKKDSESYKENMELKEEDEEDELPPPEEENEARELNTGNIIAVIAIGALVIFLFLFIGLNIAGKKKKTTEENELDKAGTKTVIEFKDKSYQDYQVTDFEEENEVQKDEEVLDDVLESLPPELLLPSQTPVGQAPVSSVGSTGSGGGYKTERPDTRNSKSPRKIEGLASLNYVQASPPVNTVSEVLNGNYQGKTTLKKEEYVAQHLKETQDIQNMLYGSGYTNASSGNGYLSQVNNRESFYSAGSYNGGNGTYLSRSTLWDGTVISGVLLTAINTDNPGLVIARVTENVYSSFDHSFLLIPEGSLLMATYNSSVSYGQNRVQVAWNILIRPDNYRIVLGNMNGVNAQGISGYKGIVYTHPWETLKAFGMIALYSFIQTEASMSIPTEKNEYIKNMMSDVYAEGSKMGNQMIDRALDIKPTIKVKEGTEIKLITNIPLDLPPVQIPKTKHKYVRTR